MPLHIRIKGGEKAAQNMLFVLIAFEIALVFIFICDFWLLDESSWTIHTLFDLDGEANIPTWFSSVQLFVTGAILSFTCKKNAIRDRPSQAFFMLIGAIFIFLSADEAAGLHEKISYIIGANVNFMPKFTEKGHGAWILPYIAVGFVIFIYSFRDLVAVWKHFRRETAIVIIGIFVFSFGAIGMESINLHFQFSAGSTPLFDHISVVFEEFLEMVGVSVILYGTILFAISHDGLSEE